ncbi:MAG: winged helix-turn-helix domain-containing protein, partial [Akkermansia sp.]|nr:winged helix-turn-helix domain-containing protein [Akkermansia sp.]
TLENKIMMILETNPRTTQTQISQITECALRTVKRAMKKMAVDGKIVRQGSRKNGEWKIL